ncbi:MAG: hypothetical protein [Bacteriophage sp.]|nr:MAG: hypothetical protein [Bacteriophage sp.]
MSDKDENVTNVQMNVDGLGILGMITDLLNDCKIAYVNHDEKEFMRNFNNAKNILNSLKYDHSDFAAEQK